MFSSILLYAMQTITVKSLAHRNQFKTVTSLPMSGNVKFDYHMGCDLKLAMLAVL